MSTNSFFPTVLQPAISFLVNPIHRCILRIGLVKPHELQKNTPHTLTSVVSIQNVDMHDMERRRQIALKALSERLSRTTDASRQNLLPKSFPHHHHQGHQHGHGHSHGQHFHGSDSNQPPFIAPKGQPMSFIPPAIPLPPPPSMAAPSTSNHSEQAQGMQNANLIDLNSTNTNSANNS